MVAAIGLNKRLSPFSQNLSRMHTNSRGAEAPLLFEYLKGAYLLKPS